MGRQSILYSPPPLRLSARLFAGRQLKEWLYLFVASYSRTARRVAGGASDKPPRERERDAIKTADGQIKSNDQIRERMDMKEKREGDEADAISAGIGGSEQVKQSPIRQTTRRPNKNKVRGSSFV